MFLITKIDKRDANIEQVEGSIAAHFESSEIYPISAKTGKGVDEMLMFLHEKLSERNLAAPSRGFGEGHVLEVDAKNRGLGISATVLCTRGEFKPGNMVLTGSNACKIRAIFDENKNKMKSAKPGEFFQMTGFKSVPEPGSYIQSENKAVIMRAQKFRQAEAKKQLEKRFEIDNETSKRLEFDRAVMEKKIELGFFKLDKSQQVFYTQMLEKKRLDDLELKKSYSFYFLIKGDVSGSVEAIVDAIGAFEPLDDEPAMSVVNFDVGELTAQDIKEAASNKPKLSIINFNQPIPPKIAKEAKKHDIKIYNSRIIYTLIDEIREDLAEAMPIENFEEVLGVANVLAVFNKKVNPDNKKEGKIGGCVINEGYFSRDSEVELWRDGISVYTCNASELFFKANPVEEIESGEFGISFDWTNKGFLPGDVLKCISRESSKRPVTWEWS